MGTICITGSASGMGAATAARLRDHGHTVIGVDVRDADVVADLGSPEGRAAAIAGVEAASSGTLDGFAPFAGIGGLPDRAGSLVASVNYFGTSVLLEGLRPLLATGTDPSVVVISSNSTTCQPDVPQDLIDAFLADDEPLAREIADGHGSVVTYPASKIALARWVRRHAVGPDWAGAGIRLNAVAPGLVDTALTAEQRADPTMAPLIAQFPIPLGRGGRPEELAALVEFLLGPDSTFFCGSVIWCDGGTDALLRGDDWPAVWHLEGM
ncbi:MAG: SDR family oxidoreductase [Acidimicrobiia bacterium]|jgi:NAD(P)-dependent dehydrogenase (short-subunit alcohol dehydrogenase family)